jgi:hypothetical protein
MHRWLQSIRRVLMYFLVIHSTPSLVCLSSAAAEYADPEQAEDYKVRSFIAMTRSCPAVRHVVYAPLLSMAGAHLKMGFALEGSDMMEAEQWPLVQAYASEVCSTSPPRC